MDIKTEAQAKEMTEALRVASYTVTAVEKRTPEVPQTAVSDVNLATGCQHAWATAPSKPCAWHNSFTKVWRSAPRA